MATTRRRTRRRWCGVRAWAAWVRPAWVWAVVGGVGEAGVGKASEGMGTGVGVKGVGEDGVVGVTTSVGSVGCCALSWLCAARTWTWTVWASAAWVRVRAAWMAWVCGAGECGVGVVGVGMCSMDMSMGDVGMQGVGRGRHEWCGCAGMLCGYDRSWYWCGP